MQRRRKTSSRSFINRAIIIGHHPSAVLNCNTMHYTVFREESKQDSDMDEPWIMTVKGPHGVKGSVVPMLPLDEQPASLTLTHTNHRSSNHNQLNKPHANGASRSPPKDSTLNHYRNESRDSLRDGQAKHAPVCSNNRLCHILYSRLLSLFLIFFFSFFCSLDHTKPHLHHRWIRERNEMSETIVTPAESPRSENRRKCAIAATGTEKSSGNENGTGKAEIGIEPAGTSIPGRKGETVNRMCPLLRWPITDHARISRGREVHKSSSIREASLYPVLFFLFFPRYYMLNIE